MPENKKAIIPTGSTHLMRVGNSIRITNRILFGSIENLFNEAFLKMNSKQLLKDKNYLLLFETDPAFQRKNKYRYKANTVGDYEVLIVIGRKISVSRFSVPQGS